MIGIGLGITNAALRGGFSPVSLYDNGGSLLDFTSNTPPTIFKDAGATQAQAGGTVQQVSDTSGNGIDATQPNAALRPQLVDQGNGYTALRLDGVDDKLELTFPDGFTGDLFLAGRGGCWVEEGVTIAPGGKLDIGPQNGPKTPGIIRAVGGENIDLLAALPIDRTLTDYERRSLAEYYKERGAKGLLVPDGVELVDFDNLTDQGTGWFFEGGILKKTEFDSTIYNLGATVASGRTYKGKYTKQNHTAGNPAISVNGSNYTGIIDQSMPDGSYEFILSIENGGTVGINGQSALIEFSDFSIQRLVPEEEL